MSTYPRLEARVSALERRQTNTETHIEEVTGEITASIKQLSEDMEASFKQLSEYLIKTEEQTEERLNKIETAMATKEDIAAMETRILDTFKQMLTLMNPQRPPSE